MKKTLSKVAIFGGAALLLSLPSVGMAQIQGQCSDCHTMHNSEEGLNVAIVDGWSGVSPTPNEVLLKYDCIACHAMDTGAALVTLAGGSVVPQVARDTGATDLAGGNFSYIDGTRGSMVADDRKGHNVIDVVDADLTLTGPPGYARGPAADQTNNTSIHTFEMASQFTCAGKAGCHGVRNQSILVSEAVHDSNGIEITPAVTHPRTGLAALTGAHHYDVGGVLNVADDIYNSYRFLMGTTGLESANYANELGDHNEYSGANNDVFAEGTSGCDRCHVGSHGMSTEGYVTNVSGTITNFCETCHSNFHASQALDLGTSTGAFLRHPSDFVIRDKTEYSAIAGWDATAPVARVDYSTMRDTVDIAGAGEVVACLSCHVGHASDYAHMLRFDYTLIEAGGGANDTGCFVCHTTKDTGDGNTWPNPMLQ
jgi:hypothetical protein